MNLLAPVFKIITRLRAKLYVYKIFKSYDLPVPVISIGNLTMGGTGKTPFTIWLLKKYQEKYKIGVVVRSYKASLKLPKQVELSLKSSEVFGDEAVLIQNQLQKVIVYSGPSKYQTAQKLLSEKNPEFIVVDDGFQHFKLSRNLDIVLLDSSVPLSDYSWPPIGRLREDFSALNRADIVILTKIEMKNEKTYEFLKSKIPASCVLFESEQTLGNLIYIGGSKVEYTTLKDKKIFGFAGLANPVNFHRSLERSKIPVQDFFGLPDHVNYSADLIKEIIERAKNFDFCITTEKDAVKLQDWPAVAPALFVAPIELQLKANVEGLYEKINECLGKSN